MNKDERIAQLEDEIRKLKTQSEGVDVSDNEELKKRRDTLETLNKMINVAAYRSVRVVHTGTLGIDYVNCMWEKIIGVTAKDTFADIRNVFKYCHHEDLPLLMQQINTSLEPLNSFEIEVRYFHPVNEKWIWLQISSYPRRVDDYIYAEGFVFDITKSKLAEIELKSEKLRLETLGNNIPGGALYRLVLDTQTEKLSMSYVSEKWEEIMGCPAGDFLSDNDNALSMILHDDLPLVAQAIYNSIKTSGTFDVEFRVLIGGSIRWIQMSSYPRREGMLIVWDGVCMDVTKRKKNEAELEKHREQLEILVQQRTNELNTANEELISTNEALVATNDELASTNEELDRYKTQLEAMVEQKTKEVIIEKNAIETLINSIPSASLVRLQFDPSGLSPEKLLSHRIWRERLQFVYARTNWDILGMLSIVEMKSMEDVLFVFDKYHSDDVFVFRSQMLEAIRSLSRFTIEVRFSLPGKEMQWHQISARPYRENGVIIFDFFFFDITERKNTELALTESERKQRFVFSNTKDVFWIADSETSLFTFFSGNCYETFGAESGTYIGKSLYDCFLPENRAKIEAIVKQKVEEYYEMGVQHFQLTEQQYDKNREKIWVETSFQLVPDENGKITQIVGVVKNIDLRKRIEIELADYRGNLELLVQKRTDELATTNEELESTNEELSTINDDLHHKNIQLIDEIKARLEATKRLENSESRLRDFIEQSYTGIIVLENDGRVSEWNKAQTRLTGISREEALGEDCWEIWRKIISEEEVTNNIHYMINLFSEQTDGKQEQTGGNMEVIIRPGTENQRYAVLNAFLIKQEDSYRVGMMCRDITESKITDIELERYRTQLEYMVEQKTKELVAAKEKAEESDRLKSAFLANMSHEIRTPLNAICGILQFIDSDTTPEQRKEYIKLINNSSLHLMKLIDDIIDISKIEARQMTISPVPVNLNELMYELHVFFEIYLHSNDKGHVELNLDDSRFINPCLIYVDPVRLRQVLINLIGNAVKFTEIGRISFGYHQSSSDQLQFMVKDNGIGIPANQKDVIFERFRQVQTGNNRQYGGTGLGLAISRNIVQLNGGNIWVESVEGKGSAFYFTISYLPVAPKD